MQGFMILAIIGTEILFFDKKLTDGRTNRRTDKRMES